MKKIIYQKNLHKTWLSRYQVSCIFILLKNNTTQHTLHAHACTCSLQNRFLLLSPCHVTNIPHNPLRQCDYVSVVVARTLVVENILPRHVFLKLRNVILFYIYIYIYIKEFNSKTIGMYQICKSKNKNKNKNMKKFT